METSLTYNSSSTTSISHSDVPMENAVIAIVNSSVSFSSSVPLDIGDYFWSISDWQAWYNGSKSNGGDGVSTCGLMPLNVATQTFLVVVFALVTIVCGIGNILLCFIIFMQKRLQTVTNLLIANLAVSDALVGLLCAPFSLHFYFNQNWVFGEIMCPLVGTVKSVSLYVSVNTLLVIAADR